ncbi:uncharacterized protein LOC135930403 [Gordionus sp. m RMFG-2023]|uniref:uncharacterized protein LOC135930403 n=1 Tax=Gordionus sp. m RMFG-2023 TaxID=3053472 RepID=UPI0031FC1899
MIYSIWCLLILINYNVVRGCEINTMFNGSLEKKEINGNDLFLISIHDAGSMHKDCITFKSCNGTLFLYHAMNDGFSFVNPLIVLLNSTATYKKYRLNNKGTNTIIKGQRIGNDQRYTMLHWRNY